MYQNPNRFLRLMKSIWPYINKGINSVFYFIINLIKTIISEAIRMVKTGGID